LNLSPLPLQKFFDNDGRPLVAGLLFIYAAGTTTKVSTWQESAGVSLNSNPIILNFRGEARVWLDPTLAYKFVLAPANDTDPPTAPIWTVDDITAGPPSSDNAAEDTGSGNSVQLDIPRLSGTPQLFDRIVWKSNLQNTGPVTITINGGLSKSLLWQNRESVSAGALQVDGMYEAIYDGLTWQLQGPALGPEHMITVEEFVAGVVPTNYTFLPRDIRRYGAAIDGVTDDTGAVQAWASLGGDLSWPVVGTSIISAQINLESNSTITFAKGAVIQTATPGINLFSANSKTNIRIDSGKFKQTTANNAASVGGIIFDACSFCQVLNCEFEGMQWAGVYLNNSSNCDVVGNYFHDFLASAAGDKSDIIVYRNSSFNNISSNRCYGGLNVDNGILVQDPGGIGTFLPSYNKVINNRVRDHKSYGIAVYIGGTQQGNNEVSGNIVENITGNGIFAGSGIYCVGRGLGAQKVIANVVRNCCISITNALNGPAGISVNDTVVGASKLIVCDNIVEEMTQCPGILVSTCIGGAIVTGNNVRMPVQNNGTGPGGAAFAGEGIRLFSSDDVDVSGNVVLQLGTADAFNSFASSVSLNRINVNGNIFRASVGNALRFDRTAAFVYTDCVISGNQLRTDAAANMMQLTGCDRLSVTGNCGSANTASALSITSCTRALISNNSGNTNGANGVATAGTCTGSYYALTNNFNGTIINAATGLKTAFFSNVSPATGTAAVGDSAEQSVPAVGSPKGWRCTVAGSPGTWVSRGNL
jgi:hypothetical protein